MPITETVNLFARGLGQTITLGVPLKESFNVTDVTTLRLKDGATTLAATFTVGSRWKGLPTDTSKAIKWARVTFKDTNTPRTLVVDSSGSTVPAQTNPLVIANNTNDIQVSNGLLNLTINKQANAFDLLTSAQFGTEVLHATNKPRLSVPIDKKTSTTWTTNALDFAAVPTNNTIKVGNASIFSVGETVDFSWEGTVQDYYPTGGPGGAPFIIMAAPFTIADLTRTLMTSVNRVNIIINPGGSQVVVPIDFSDSQGFCLLSAPGVTPTPGMKIRIQGVENEANKTIQSINAGASTLTFTSAFTQYMPQGVDVLPTVAASSTAAMALTGAVIERQYGDKRVIVKQNGVLKDVNNGTQVESTLKFEVRHYLSADTPYVITGITIRNHRDVATEPECPSVYFRALNFDLPTAVAGTAASDSVTDNTLATTRYKANNYHSTLNHGGVANFQWSVFQFNLEFPNTIAVDSAGCRFSIFPESAGPIEFEGSAIKTRYVVWGLNAAQGLQVLENLGATLDAAYVAATKAVRPNIVEKRNWTTIFASESQRLRDAATRYERMAASPYDITACEAVSGSRPAMTLKEYRWEYPERSGGSTIFGWNKFGNVNEDVGFGNNRYDLPYILFREGLREGTQAKALQAFQLGFQQIRNRMELGQYWSHKNFNGIAGLNLHGLARYERAYAPDPFNYTNQLAPTHSWNEGTCLYWALTDDPIAEEAAKAGAAQAARYDYQGTYGARLFGTGAYQMKDPSTGQGGAEPRYVAWPILNLIVGYRYFGEPTWLTKAVDYARCFITTMAGETQQDGFIDFVGTDGTIQPLFQHGGYCMHGIIEAWRESTGQDQTDLATYIGKVANFLYKGDQRLGSVGPDSPLLANGVPHPNDATKYNPAIYFPFSYKRSFAASLTAAVNTSQVTIPVDDTSTFLLANNGNYGNPAADAVGILISDINDPATWEYFRYTGRSTTSGAGNLTGVTRAFGASGAKSFAQGAIVYPLGLGGALNDIVVATLIAGARVTGTQQLQDFAEKIWIDNCLYRDEYTTDNPAFVTRTSYSPINFWPKNVGPNAPKLTAQSLTALSEFLGDRVTPQPIPTISSISPTVIATGAGNTTITVNGQNYDPNAVVRLGSTDLTTTFVSATQVTAVIPSASLAAPGTLSITVRNPLSGNTSGAVSLPVANRPTISSLFPDNKVAGEASFVLIINGTNFEANSTVTINGVSRTTTFVNASRLDVQVLAADITTVGNKPVVVTNPSSTLQSVAVNLTVQTGAVIPTLISITPNNVTVGSGNLNVTITGTNFQSAPLLHFGAETLATTFVSATQLTAIIPANLLTTPGVVQVFIENPNTQVSGNLPFTIAAVGAPTVSSVSPASVQIQSASGAITITGTNLSGATVTVAGVAVTPTSNSATQIVLPSQTFTTAGSKAIAITTGGGTINTSITATNPAPTVSSLTPTQVTAGATSLQVTITGTGFVSGAVAKVNGVARATVVNSATQVLITLTQSDLATAGALTITVENPAPGGGVSAGATFTVNAVPAPSIASIAPSSTTVNGSAFTLTVNGANFVSGAVVKWGGVSKTTTFVSATQLTATILGSDIALAGTVQVTVQNPDSQISAANNFTVQPVNAPTISGVSPSTAIVGVASGTITITGANLASATVTVDGQSVTPISNTSTQIVLPGQTFSTAGNKVIAITTAGGSINATLTVNNPAPTLSSLSPIEKTAGDPQFTLTVNGTGFIAGSAVRWNGSALTTTYISPTQLTAIVPGSLLASAGLATITVQTAAPGGGTSSGSTFTINAVVLPAPALTSLAPTTGTAGTSSLLVAVLGSNFQAGAIVRVNGQNRTTSFVSSTQLTVTLTSADLLTTGTLVLTVLNPDAQASSGANFVVNPAPNPTPVIASASPAAIQQGAQGVALTVNGANFVTGSIIRIGGQVRATTYLSSTQLTTVLQAGDTASVGPLSVAVENPTPGGGLSAVAQVAIANLVPLQPTLRAGLALERRTLRIRQGDTFSDSYEVRIDGVLANLTNVAAKMQVRAHPADDSSLVLLELSSANGGILIDALRGRVTFAVPAATTSLLRFTRAYYDLQLTDTNGVSVTVLKGDVLVEQEFTR